MIKRLAYFLLRPRKLIQKIQQKRADYDNRKNFHLSDVEKEQAGVFENLLLSRQQGLDIKKSLFPVMGEIDDSEHTTFFASLSACFKAKKILEIGTYDGRNARLLSILFPDAEIETVDLADDDPLFINSYNREKPEFMARLLKARNENLRSGRNIKFTQINSLRLLNYDSQSYDLIWVDGAHGYPIVAIDIANSIRLLKEGGFMMCDDVWVGRNIDDSDFMYKSGATIETLMALKQAKMIDYSLVYKRIDFSSAGNPDLKEYIAVARPHT
jgi:predicted O-methyltransferase YrrM